MTKYVLADFRMRKEEKEYIESLGYEIIEVSYNPDLYDEIAAHVDISYVKINNTVITSPDRFVDLSKIIECDVGKTDLEREYPKDIPYNVCIMGTNAIHNFKYTDEIVKEKLEKEEFNLIDVKQGYTKCSIAVIDENSCITSDMDIAKKLMDNGIDVLFVCEPDIKLLKRTNPNETVQNRMFFEHSDMQGFIGGAMARIDDEIILFGDVNKLLNKDKIINFINSKGIKFKCFEGLDVIDYGSVVVIDKEGEKINE